VAGPLTRTGTAPLRAARPLFLATIRPKSSVALISSNLSDTAPTRGRDAGVLRAGGRADKAAALRARYGVERDRENQ